jgi:uncharacterized protein YbjT (DUF2867 family)
MNTSTVVVHGASGVQGAPVARQLLAAGHRVRAVVRHGRPDAGEEVVADLLHTDALIAAYRGADAVVVQLPLVFTADLAMAQAQSVLRALSAVEVRQVVFNSGATLPPGPVGVPYVDARVTLAARLPELTPASTVVSPAATYMENLAAPWSAPKVRAGELAYPLPEEAPVPWVAVDDLAAVVVDLLATATPPSRQVVTGPKALTGDEAAAELTAALGHLVRWRSISPNEYEQMLIPHLGAEAAAGIAAAYTPPPPGTPPVPEPDPSVVRTGGITLRDWAATRTWA